MWTTWEKQTMAQHFSKTRAKPASARPSAGSGVGTHCRHQEPLCQAWGAPSPTPLQPGLPLGWALQRPLWPCQASGHRWCLNKPLAHDWNGRFSSVRLFAGRGTRPPDALRHALRLCSLLCWARLCWARLCWGADGAGTGGCRPAQRAAALLGKAPGPIPRTQGTVPVTGR